MPCNFLARYCTDIKKKYCAYRFGEEEFTKYKEEIQQMCVDSTVKKTSSEQHCILDSSLVGRSTELVSVNITGPV